MEDLTEAQMRMLKRARELFYPQTVYELKIVRELFDAGLLTREAGRYRLSDEGLKWITRHGIDGVDHFYPVT